MRRRSFNDPGHAHFLTFSCLQRYRIFEDDQACLLLAVSIDRARVQHEFDLWAYVFMPDHIHLLIRPRRDEYSVSEILRSIKSSFAPQFLSYGQRILSVDAPSLT
jgi:putative transposase